jgi:hypothetical protein
MRNRYRADGSEYTFCARCIRLYAQWDIGVTSHFFSWKRQHDRIWKISAYYNNSAGFYSYIGISRTALAGIHGDGKENPHEFQSQNGFMRSFLAKTQGILLVLSTLFMLNQF